jgi:glycosyltransferase involved in cell wall biosynthesis
VGKIKVLHICNQLALGGAEKTLQVFCKYLDKSRFEVFACGRLGGGVRVAELEKGGIPVILRPANINELVRDLKIDIYHMHRSGHYEPGWIPEKEAGWPRIVETSIFGDVDHVDDALIDCHLFVSQFLRNQYIRKYGQRSGAQYEVLYNPVDFDECANGTKNFDHTIGRCSRPDDQKWHDVCVDSLPKVFRKVPQTRCIFQGATDRVKTRLTALGLIGRVELVEPSIHVSDLYRQLDIFTHGARIGETFGLVIAEAMAYKIPVVTLSTPQRKKANAQTELVENGVTGFVCTSTRQYADAVVELLKNETIRSQFAQRGFEKAWEQFEAGRLTRKLEEIYSRLMDCSLQPVGGMLDVARSRSHLGSRMSPLVSFVPVATEFLLRHPTKLSELRRRWRNHVGRYGKQRN